MSTNQEQNLSLASSSTGIISESTQTSSKGEEKHPKSSTWKIEAYYTDRYAKENEASQCVERKQRYEANIKPAFSIIVSQGMSSLYACATQVNAKYLTRTRSTEEDVLFETMSIVTDSGLLLQQITFKVTDDVLACEIDGFQTDSQAMRQAHVLSHYNDHLAFDAKQLQQQVKEMKAEVDDEAEDFLKKSSRVERVSKAIEGRKGVIKEMPILRDAQNSDNARQIYTDLFKEFGIAINWENYVQEDLAPLAYADVARLLQAGYSTRHICRNAVGETGYVISWVERVNDGEDILEHKRFYHLSIGAEFGEKPHKRGSLSFQYQRVPVLRVIRNWFVPRFTLDYLYMFLVWPWNVLCNITSTIVDDLTGFGAGIREFYTTGLTIKAIKTRAQQAKEGVVGFFKNQGVGMIVGAFVSVFVGAIFWIMTIRWYGKRDLVVADDQPHTKRSRRFWKLVMKFVQLVRAWNASLIRVGLAPIITPAAVDHLNTALVTADFANEVSTLLAEDEDDEGIVIDSIDTVKNKISEAFNSKDDQPHTKPIVAEDDLDEESFIEEMEVDTKKRKGLVPSKVTLQKLFGYAGIKVSEQSAADLALGGTVAILITALVSAVITFIFWYFKKSKSDKDEVVTPHSKKFSKEQKPAILQRIKKVPQGVGSWAKSSVRQAVPISVRTQGMGTVATSLEKDYSKLSKFRVTNSDQLDALKATEGSVTATSIPFDRIGADLTAYPTVIFGVDGNFYSVPKDEFMRNLAVWQDIIREMNVRSGNQSVAAFVNTNGDIRQWVHVGVQTLPHSLKHSNYVDTMIAIRAEIFDVDVPQYLVDEVKTHADVDGAIDGIINRIADVPHTSQNRIERALVRVLFSGKNENTGLAVQTEGVGLAVGVDIPTLRVMTSQHLLYGYPSNLQHKIVGTFTIYSDHAPKGSIGHKSTPFTSAEFKVDSIGWEAITVTFSKPLQSVPFCPIEMSTQRGPVAGHVFTYRGHGQLALPIRMVVLEHDKISAWAKLGPGDSGAPCFDLEGKLVGVWFGIVGSIATLSKVTTPTLFAGGSSVTSKINC